MDQDVLLEMLAKLHIQIRYIRDQRGDDKCYKDWYALFAMLPEGYTPPVEDESVEIENCKRYIRSCHDPNVKYTSPQIKIAELEAKINEMTLTIEQQQSTIEGLRDALDQDFMGEDQ